MKLSTAVAVVVVALALPATADEAPQEDSLVGAVFAQEEARMEVMAVDKACSDRAQVIGFGPAIAEYALEDMTYLPDRAQPILGLDAIRAALGGKDENSTVIWAPEDAFMSGSMDLAVTWGRYVFKGTTPEGTPFESHGKYTSVWRKDADGHWKFALDTGNTNPKPEE